MPQSKNAKSSTSPVSSPLPASGRTRRNKSFEATHQALIEASVRLISEKGVEALSISALARAVGLNRATVYYHFADREALLAAVSAWSSRQIVQGFTAARPQPERIDFVGRFVLENPDLLKLWIEKFIAPGDIRENYIKWDEFVAASKETLGRVGGEAEEVDVEVYCTMMLVGAIIGPRVFQGSVRPDLDNDAVIERFRKEHQRMLRRDGLLHD
ncbi:TetR/AcrR family transcriptional regulator [Novosphingobium sp. BL-8A]|uniref:TetR/AcrR family transcriptional regulator n=1 Tax=Novosphingobium sp. BL-8A TaxID=3127639 RepID=UPI0037571C10